MSSVPGKAPAVKLPPHVAGAREHYEINAYEAAIRLSDALGAEDVGGLLRANLRREAERLAGSAL